MTDTPKRILVVDDTPGNRYAVARVLRLEGYEVLEGAKGQDALDLATSEKPDLIILDVKLPDMLGFEAAALLRRAPETAHISILNVSASYTSADAQAYGLGSGADGYLVHPIDPKVLVATVRSLLRLRDAESRAASLLKSEQAARARAEERERHYQFLSEMLPQIVWTATPDGAFDYFNGHWTEATGLTIEEGLGWGWTKAVDDTDLERVVSLWRQAVASGEPHEVEYRLKDMRTGKSSWRLRRAAPLKDDAGRVVKWFGSSTDIDQQKELIAALRQSEARLKRLWHSGLMGILYWTADGGILDANDAFLDLIGYTREELEAGKINLWAILPIELHGGRERALEEISVAGVSNTFESQFIRKDGTRVDVLLGGAAFEHEPGHGLTIALDISDRKRFELERTRLMRELEQALRARDELLAIASHDLKGPLTAISLRVDLLMRTASSADGLPAARVIPSLQVMARQLDQVVRLLENLLDVSRIRGGALTIERERVDLTAAAWNVVERFTEQAHRAGSVLSLETTGTIVGEWDRMRVDQIIANLVTNAIKYGDGNPIEILIDGTATIARIAVRDHGIGISPEDQLRIFDRFERAHAKRDLTSVGLGLWIVQHIIAAHGGTISVVSALGEGSTFIVELPRFAPAEHALSP